MKWIKNLLCIGVVALIVYSGIMLAMPQYRYYMLKSDVGEVMKLEFYVPEQFQKAIIEQASKIGAPVAESNIVVIGTEGRFTARLAWSETVSILGMYKKNFDFVVEASNK